MDSSIVRPSFEVDIGPAQRAGFAPSGTGRRHHADERRHAGVLIDTGAKQRRHLCRIGRPHDPFSVHRPTRQPVSETGFGRTPSAPAPCEGARLSTARVWRSSPERDRPT